MATIAQTTGVSTASAAIALTGTTLTASDTLTYVQGAVQRINLVNGTGSTVTVTFTGTAPNTVIPVTGYGSVSAAGGKAIAVPANSTMHLNLDNISNYLAGTGAVTVTGGTGVTAFLYV